MSPDIKKILFVTDLSKEANEVFAYTARIASYTGAGIVILHVMEEDVSANEQMLVNLIGKNNYQELRGREEQRAQNQLIGKRRETPLVTEALRTFCEKAREDLPECQFGTDEIVVTHGIVVETILKEMKSRECDLIVMGYQGRSRVSEAIMGSTTKDVLRKSDRPVLVVPVHQIDK